MLRYARNDIKVDRCVATEKEILEALSNVQEPELGKDLVTRGMIKDITIQGTEVPFTVELTTPACPYRDQITA